MAQGEHAGPSLPKAARSPFRPVLPNILAALVYVAALAVWVGADGRLPGGRWMPVHLFTLGVLTNLVLTFSGHFSRTLTRSPSTDHVRLGVAANVGIVLMLIGLPGQRRWLLTVGAVVVTGAILTSWSLIRAMRHRAVGARFAWIVRVYERAHGAFVHGAILGALMGIGVLTGAWYGSARVAHMHVNILGWGGLTLLATLVFFGPTMARTRIEPGADDRAARALRWGAGALTVAVVLLLLTALDGVWSDVARLGAGAGIGVFAWAATVTCLPVSRAVRAAKPTASGPLVFAVACWFPAVAWADAVVVAAGWWRWLDALGIIALAGVLAQAMLATLLYLAPMLRGRHGPERDTIRRRLEAGARTRALVVQLAVLACAIGAAGLTEQLPVGGAGWIALAAVAVAAAAAAWWPVAASTDVSSR